MFMCFCVRGIQNGAYGIGYSALLPDYLAHIFFCQTQFSLNIFYFSIN
jgi:hypothetical protein